MDSMPEAAGVAPAPQTEATPINSNPVPVEPTPAPAPAVPDMHGFTSDQLADMQKFFQANGGYDKVKSRISNPTPAQPQQPQQPQYQQPQPQPEQPKYQAPAGSITREEFLAQQYFGALAREEKYAPIAKEVESGAILKDMAAFNIRPLNQDGSINDMMIRRYLDLKAQTVAAKQTNVTPESSAAPTVEYAPYDENNLDMRQAMAILQQDSALKGRGMSGHPNAQQAEDFMKKFLNGQK